jgi:hypothetical protein
MDLMKTKKKIELDEGIFASTRKEVVPEEPIDDYQKTLKSLEEKSSMKTWIGVSVFDKKKKKNKIVHKNLKECTSEEFIQWICEIYPPARAVKHDPKEYESPEMREKVFLTIVSGMKSFQFPKTKHY